MPQRKCALAELRKAAGDAEEEDDADDAAIGCACPSDPVVDAGVRSAGAERSAHGCGHDGVHEDEADGECGETEESARSSAETFCKEEEAELAGCFRADA